MNEYKHSSSGSVKKYDYNDDMTGAFNNPIDTAWVISCDSFHYCFAILPRDVTVLSVRSRDSRFFILRFVTLVHGDRCAVFLHSVVLKFQ